MFKGLSGLKKAVKGGISAVAEHGSNLAESVVSDPATSKDHLKESLKKKVQGGVATVVEASDGVLKTEAAGGTREKATEVVHNLKHYGGFGEEYLGYSDPTKELRKAVKQKEKAAKKARKAAKKKTGKKGEDLFDPENLAKYKAEIEEKRRRAAEAAEAPEAGVGSAAEQESDENKDKESPQREDLYLNLDSSDAAGLKPSSRPGSSAVTPVKSGAVTPKDTDDWKNFLNLTSGVDHLIKKTQEELQEIKQESYFQKKEVVVEDKTKAALEAKRLQQKKKWVDLDEEGFEDFDGTVRLSDDESGGKEDDAEDVKAQEGESVEQSADQEVPQAAEEQEAAKAEPPLLFKVPSLDDFDPSEDEDAFNTDFVTAITTGEVKLAVIPDSPVFDEDDPDDPFNTRIAESVVKQEKEAKRKEETKLKFTGLSAVADVLAGKTEKLDKSAVEHAVKKKRRRANRINLIAEDADDVTAVEDIGTIEDKKGDKEQGNHAEAATTDDILGDLGSLPVPEGDLLTTTPSPGSNQKSATQQESADQKAPGLLDLAEFEDTITTDASGVELTSNVAILAGEFAEPKAAVDDEEDDFDAAFDALAQESFTKSKLEELEKEFENDDIFDTTAADKILNLASLTDKVEEPKPEEELDEDAFDDPFDTSAYDKITGEVETELDFDSLATRETVTEAPEEVKEAASSDVFGTAPATASAGEGWAAFGPKKPPPRPAPPRPAPKRPPPLGKHLDPSDAPSVVVKAPSTESIKSWNCAVADNLLRKSAEEALPEEEEEYDPFDTKEYENIPGVYKAPEDPFDTSNFEDKEEDSIGEERVPDTHEVIDLLAGDAAAPDQSSTAPLQPLSTDPNNPEVDPFDTTFAAEVLPDKGDPFNTSYVKGDLGRAELKALEEELLKEDEFDPRTLEGTAAPKQNLPGVAARVRPKSHGAKDLGFKAESFEEEEEEDPFDTSIVDKVIPVRKAPKRSEVSVEDDEFDPTKAFQKSKEIQSLQEEEVDPFDTSAANRVLPGLPEPPKPPTPPQEKRSEEIESDIDSDDFDPRA